MTEHIIEGPVISFVSSDKDAKEKAASITFTAAALQQRGGKTIIIVKCDFGDMPEVFAKMIAADYKKIANLKMQYLASNKNGASVTLINNN